MLRHVAVYQLGNYLFQQLAEALKERDGAEILGKGVVGALRLWDDTDDRLFPGVRVVARPQAGVEQVDEAFRVRGPCPFEDSPCVA